MKTKFLLLGCLFFLMNSIVFPQEAQIENYDNAVRKATDKDSSQIPIEVIIPVYKGQSEAKKGTNSIKPTKPNKDVIDQERIILFRETFSDTSLDNRWLRNSDTKNMIGYYTRDLGKVLKISNNYQRTSMIEIYLDDSYKGKNLMLECMIKTENIVPGEKSYHTGQLAIEYEVGNKFVYPAVQKLIYTSDWNSYFAREDGSTDIDNTDFGPYVFTIPLEAGKIRLYLGLQECTGTIYFKNLILYEVLKP